MITDSNKKIIAAWIFAAFLLSSLAIAIAYYPLSWGLMDDAAILTRIHGPWAHLSLVQVVRQNAMWLWFRPVFVVYAYLGYGTFSDHPKLFYFFNYLFVLLTCLPWVLLMRRHLVSLKRSHYLVIYILLLLAATPLYNVLIYLSLQEKFVIGFGGAALWLLELALESDSSAGFSTLAGLSLSSYVLGLWSKPTTLFILGAAFILILFAGRAAKPGRFILLLLWSAISAVMVYSFLSRKDPYSSQYSLTASSLIQRLLHQRSSVYLFAGVGLFAGLLIGRSWMQQDEPKPPIGVLLWPLLLLSYIAMLLPWGLITYLWAPGMVVLAGTVTLMAASQNPKWFPWALAISALLACLVVFGVVLPRVARQSEIRPAVQWLSAHADPDRVDIYVAPPCYEASHALEYFTRSTQPYEVLTIGTQPHGNKPLRWLITRDECPRPADQQSTFDRTVYETPHWTIYEGSRPK